MELGGREGGGEENEMRVRGKEGEEGVQEESRVRGEVEKEQGRNTSQSNELFAKIHPI